jgi:SPW repeat
MKRYEHWQDWVILTSGAWLFFAPFFMSYGSATGAAAWDSYVVGALVVAAAVSALWTPESLSEEWVDVVLGLWLVIAPFAFGFYASEAVAAWSHIAVGILVAGDALWGMAARPVSGGHVHH